MKKSKTKTSKTPITEQVSVQTVPENFEELKANEIISELKANEERVKTSTSEKSKTELRAEERAEAEATGEYPTGREGFMLPQSYSRIGYTYEQIRRGNKAVVYEAKDETGKVMGYEVFLIKIHPAGKSFGKVYKSYERFPGDSEFGIWAWAPSTLDRAIKRYDELEAEKLKEVPASEVEVAVEE